MDYPFEMVDDMIFHKGCEVGRIHRYLMSTLKADFKDDLLKANKFIIKDNAYSDAMRLKLSQQETK